MFKCMLKAIHRIIDNLHNDGQEKETVNYLVYIKKIYLVYIKKSCRVAPPWQICVEGWHNGTSFIVCSDLIEF